MLKIQQTKTACNDMFVCFGRTEFGEFAPNSDEVVFTLKEYGSYTLELDGSHNVLHIFFDLIKEYEDAKKATRYFGPGVHFPGVIDLRDNDVVYIDRDAIVFGSINSTGAKNVRIFGGGVIDNSCEEVIVENAYENFSKGCFKIYNCENIRVEDITFENIEFDNIILGGKKENDFGKFETEIRNTKYSIKSE